jgi:hypothetical protein
VHHFDERYELLLRVRPVGEVGDGALLDTRGNVVVAGSYLPEEGAVVLHVVQRGDVHALDRGEVAQHCLARGARVRADGPLPRTDDIGDLPDRFLAVAHDEHVDVLGERLGVERAVAARHDDRVTGGAILVADRHTGEVHAVEHVGVDELGRQVEREDVEVARGTVRVDAEQRHPVAPQGALHVEPGRVRTLGDRIRSFVQDFVEDLQPLVGEPDLVGVRIDQEEGDLSGGPRGPDGAPLHTDVASRLLNPGQERLDPRPQVGHSPTA